MSSVSRIPFGRSYRVPSTETFVPRVSEFPLNAHAVNGYVP